jgi:hypothetical protein
LFSDAEIEKEMHFTPSKIAGFLSSVCRLGSRSAARPVTPAPGKEATVMDT